MPRFVIFACNYISERAACRNGHQVVHPGIGWDRNAPERRSCSFFGARNGVSVLFHDVEPFICYFLIRDSYFLRSVRCALHVARQPCSVIKRPLAQFSEKS